ncbi:MAG: serine protease [Rhodospirillales bacterium]
MQFRDIVALILLIAVALGGQLLRSDPDTPIPPPQADNPRRPAPQAFTDQPWDAETRAWLESRPSAGPRKSADWIAPERNAYVDLPKRRGSGTGTAFAVGDGKWLTARHVTDGCSEIALQTAPGKGIRVSSAVNHPNADVALLTTRSGPIPFPLGTDAARGDDGYLIGFPKGKPGAVHVSMIGTTTLREGGRYQTRERASVWSERSRIPGQFGSLGGLSGGPTFSADGRLAGVVLAEEPRRGRVLTAEVATLGQMINQAGPAPQTRPADKLSSDSYPKIARELLTSLRIAKVLCRVR